MARKIWFGKSLWQETESFAIKEGIDPKTQQKAFYIEGTAITANKPTRNGIAYTLESMEKTYKGLIGKPILDSHQDTSYRHVLGHVENAWVDNGVLKYRANLDPEEKDLIRKIQRKDINSVSIQVLCGDAEELTSSMSGDPFINAQVQEFLELSIVTIPGSQDTTMQLVEAFHPEMRKSREDITTSGDSGAPLTGTVLPKKIKKAAEPEKLLPKKEEQQMGVIKNEIDPEPTAAPANGVGEHTHEEIDMMINQMAELQNELMELKTQVPLQQTENIVEQDTSFVNDSGRKPGFDDQGADPSPTLKQEQIDEDEKKKKEQAEDEEDKKKEQAEDEEDKKKEQADPAEDGERDLDNENIPEKDRAVIAEQVKKEVARELREARKRERLSGRRSVVTSGSSGSPRTNMESLIKGAAKKLPGGKR